MCVLTNIKKIENILIRIFILLPRSCPGVRLLGAGGVKILVCVFAMAPHRLHALVLFVMTPGAQTISNIAVNGSAK